MKDAKLIGNELTRRVQSLCQDSGAELVSRQVKALIKATAEQLSELHGRVGNLEGRR
jgi:hypothetical protein